MSAPKISPASGSDSGLLSPVWAGTPVEMVTSDEAWLRSAGAWHAEWRPLRECLRLAAGAAYTAAEPAEGLVVSAERVRAGAVLTGSSLVAERLAVALSPELGKRQAKGAVTRAVRDTEAGVPPAEALRRALAGTGPAEKLSALLDELLDPADYLGAAGPLVDRALRREGAPAGPHDATTPRKNGD